MREAGYVAVLATCVYAAGYATADRNWLGLVGACLAFLVWVAFIRPRDLG